MKIIDFAKKIFTPIILLGLVVFPFVLISIYNFPSADDFSYYIRSIETGYLKAQTHIYLTWSGRYTVTSLLTLPFMLEYNNFFYKLFPVLLILSLGLGFRSLIKNLFVALSKRQEQVLLLSLMFLFFYLQPSISQGIYWFAGAATYQLANVLMLFFIISYLKWISTYNRNQFVMMIILIILIIGLNETSMLILDAFVLLITIFAFIQKKPIKYQLLCLLVVSIIFSLIVVKCPGNLTRASYYPNKEKLGYSIIKTFIAIKGYLSIWIPLIIICFMLIANKKIQVKTSLIINPYLASFITLSLVFSGFFVSYWAIGTSPPNRTINVIFFVFLLGCIYTLFCFYSLNMKNEGVIVSKFSKYLLLIILLIFCIKTNNIRQSYIDLLTGSANEYQKVLNHRVDYLKNVKGDVVVDELKVRPQTLFFDDITNDSNDWKNTGYTKYIQLKNKEIKSVRTNKED